MAESTKKCPLCAETIKAEARLCRFCGARFEVSVTGKCPVCHAEEPLNENGRCSRCGGEVADRRVFSTLVNSAPRPAAMRIPAAAAPSSPPPVAKTGNVMDDVVFNAGVLLMKNTKNKAEMTSRMEDLMNQRVHCTLCNTVVDAKKAFQLGEPIGGAMFTVSPRFSCPHCKKLWVKL